MPAGRFSNLVAVGLAVVAGSLLWLRYHAGEVDPARLELTDLVNYYYPVADLVGRALARGELPLWDPASCSGIPLLATLQPAVLYPPTWLAAVLPTDDALFVSLWIHVLAAGGFVALALRAGGLHPVAAGLGGVFYLHACLLGNLMWPPAVAVMAWLPALWLCVEKLAAQSSPSWGWWSFLSVATALQVLAGYPQYVAYGFYWLGPYALVRLFEAGRSGEVTASALIRRGAFMAVAVALGLGLAGAQLLPAAELAGQSSRGQALTAEEVHYLDVGTRPASRVVRNALDPRPKNPTFDLRAGTGYLGIASLLALVAAFVRRAGRPTTIYLAVAGIASLLLSDGFNGVAGPLFALYHELPTTGFFRTPERLRLISLLCLIVLVCRGLDELLREQRERRLILLGVLGATAIAIALLGGPGSIWRALAAFGLVALLISVPIRGPRREVVAWLWVAFVVADLTLATAPSGVLHDYPRQLSEQYRAGFRSARIDQAMLDELKALPPFTRVEPHGFIPFVGAGPAAGINRPTCYGPLAPAQWRTLHELLQPERRLVGPIGNPKPRDAPTFYDVLSVSHLVMGRKGQAVVTPNEDALPRAYLVEAASRATQREAFEHIRDASFDFSRGVLLEEATPSGPSDARRTSELPPARIVDYRADRVEIAIAPERAAWLVLTDTFYPGWHAEVGGLPARILRANGLVRAVRVEAGEQRVIFRYRPASWRAGLGVSLLSAGAIGGLAWAGRRRSWLDA
jgi:hypothetical protein